MSIKFDVIDRWSGKIKFTAEIECDENTDRNIKLGLAVKWAYKLGTDLSRTDLSGVNLSRTDLSGVNLSYANLSCAYLSNANLSYANLSCAYLSNANLSCAYLSNANLSDANLSGAYLLNANLSRANLSGANLSDVNKITDEEIPTISKIDAVILAEIENGGKLEMSSWHGPEGWWCGTTHCRAGWAVHCAGKPGHALENKVGTQYAGTMIYRKSRPGQPVPWFFAPNEIAMADIQKCAEEQQQAAE